MKELIVKVLKRYPDMNLTSEAARYILAEAILTEIRNTEDCWFLDLGLDINNLKKSKRKNLGGDVYQAKDLL